jgi:hypothetical protein
MSSYLFGVSKVFVPKCDQGWLRRTLLFLSSRRKMVVNRVHLGGKHSPRQMEFTKESQHQGLASPEMICLCEPLERDILDPGSLLFGVWFTFLPSVAKHCLRLERFVETPEPWFSTNKPFYVMAFNKRHQRFVSSEQNLFPTPLLPGFFLRPQTK